MISSRKWVIQLGAEITPDRNSVARFPASGQQHLPQKENAENAGGAYEQPDEKRNSDQESDHPEEACEKDGVGKNQPFHDRTIETHARRWRCNPADRVESRPGQSAGR